MADGTAYLIGPPGTPVMILQGERGTTPPCPEGKFKKNDMVRLRNRRHFSKLPKIAAIAAVIPPGFSPDWALADLRGEPRPLLHQVGSRQITYLVGFEGNRTPYLFKERDLLPSDLPPAEIHIEAKEEAR